MRWGDQLEFSEEAGPGDFIYVPPYVPHQEINASPDASCEAVVVRDGQDPIVVNLDLRTPEPASAGAGRHALSSRSLSICPEPVCAAGPVATITEDLYT
jgi:hypothetical protein